MTWTFVAHSDRPALASRACDRHFLLGGLLANAAVISVFAALLYALPVECLFFYDDGIVRTAAGACVRA